MRITVDLSWEPNAEADLAGYKVSWMAANGKEKAVLVQKDSAKIQLSVLLVPKLVYTFFVQAFDIAGNMSEPKKALKDVYLEG